MMQKNEVDLLFGWVMHHGDLFGFENLFIFDNGSTSSKSLQILAYATDLGVHVSYEHRDWSDFVDKGTIISAAIKSLDIQHHYDFFFPLDVDEWIAVDVGGDISIASAAIKAELLHLTAHNGALRTGYAMDNHPFVPGWFSKSPNQQKYFVGAQMAGFFDHGFHRLQTNGAEKDLRTSIVYVHFHYRNFEDIQFYSKQKLSGYIVEIDSMDFEAYNGPGFHLKTHLRMNEEEYRKSFSLDQRIYIDTIAQRMTQFSQKQSELEKRINQHGTV